MQYVNINAFDDEVLTAFGGGGGAILGNLSTVNNSQVSDWSQSWGGETRGAEIPAPSSSQYWGGETRGAEIPAPSSSQYWGGETRGAENKNANKAAEIANNWQYCITQEPAQICYNNSDKTITHNLTGGGMTFELDKQSAPWSGSSSSNLGTGLCAGENPSHCVSGSVSSNYDTSDWGGYWY